MSRILIVTGMHRSGTSLVANYLSRCGLDMGEELLPSDVGNPHGYFEDVILHDLHRDMMRAAGIDDAFTVTEADVPIQVDGASRRRAEDVVASRADKEQWGWKEPRTALFCDLWSEILPEASFLFVFRDPKAVLDSLLRRATNESVNQRPVVGLELWRTYNQQMLHFHEAHPDRTIWIEADTLPARADELVETLTSRSGLRLRPVPVSEVFDETSYHRGVRGRARMVAMRHRREARRCEVLLERLRDLATAVPTGR